MVSHSCKALIKSILNQHGIKCKTVELGYVEIANPMPTEIYEQIKISFKKYGFILIKDKRMILVERIKRIIIESVYYSDKRMKINFSTYLSNKLKYNYAYLSNLFSEQEGITIEHFIIIQKIKKAKELIMDDELNISEIAVKLHYSSTAHLSNQFKKETGMSPSCYKAQLMAGFE